MITFRVDQTFRAYRAPRQHEASFVFPPMVYFADLLANSSSKLNTSAIEFAGRSMTELRQQARLDLITFARRHTSTYRNLPVDSQEITLARPLILSGHQPELFHPGVWFKNFILSASSKQTGAFAVNLLIDQDICHSPSIRVPTRGNDGQLHAENIPFDSSGIAIPWEERGVLDRNCFDSFSKRLLAASGGSLNQPLLVELWPRAIEAVSRHARIGLALAEVRHSLEAELGLETLEVPLSAICDTESFACFLLEILTGLPRLRPLYNDAVTVYRRAHNIRSHSHPVPELSQQDDWLESPFWIYSAKSPVRRSLYSRVVDRQLELTDRERLTIRVPFSADRPSIATALLAQLRQQSAKVRPRALMTTMFSRLILSDLFSHGIGGGKYDQLTDLMIQRFFGMDPPSYCVVSATVLLPEVPSLPAVALRTAELQDRLRRLKYQPEKFPQAKLASPKLVADKIRLLQERPLSGPKRYWHSCVLRVNGKLNSMLEPTRRRIADECLRSQQELRRAILLNSREWSLCLYPKSYLERSLKTMQAEQQPSS